MSVTKLSCEKRNTMKQKSAMIQFLCTVLAASTLYAVSEFRTPLDFMRAPYLHYQLKPVEDSWWFYQSAQNNAADCRIKDEACPWNVDIASGFYERAASKAFGNKCQTPVVDPCQPASCHRDKKNSLAALWFGKSSFVAENAFAGGMLATAQLEDVTPAVAFSTITPQFKYTEKGAWVGAHVDYRIGRNKKWGVGLRASIPFKMIEVEPTLGDDPIEGGLGSVFEEQTLELNAGPAGNAVDYAYRLDFLSALIRSSLVAPLPLVEYGTTSFPTSIGGTFIGSLTPNDDGTNTPPVYVIKSASGTLPEATQLPNTTAPVTYTFAKQENQVQSAALPSTGAGVSGDVYFFDNTSNYAAALGLDRVAQSTLFVVPRMIYTNNDNAITGAPSDLATKAVTIRNAITELLNQFDFNGADSATNFLKNNCCIDLGKYERVLGVGDLQTEFYWGYTGSDKKWYANNVIGVVFPTGKQHKNPNHVYYMQPGNNGHFELRFGGEFGWGPCHYFDVRADLFYNHIFTRTEKRAAPFKGATIKNIGAPIDVDVSWDAVTGHIDLDFFNPYNKELGLSVGYEGYYRTKDRVDLCQKTAVDCLGNTQPLDASVLEKGTSTVSHKIRVEVFNRCNYFEFFLGASHVVAGRNVMQETEAHIGTVIYF